MPNRTDNLRTIIKVGFILRVIIAIWNGFFGPSPYGDGDAGSFHYYAGLIAQGVEPFREFNVGTGPYINSLAVIYRFTIESCLLGCLLSCVAWLVSARLLIKSMYLLSFDKSHQCKVMRIYSLLPSSIFMTGITLREPYQLLFVNLAFYSIVRIYFSNSPKHWICLLCAVTGMGMLHGSLFVFATFLLLATLVLLALRGKAEISLVKLVIAVPLVIFLFSFSLSLFIKHSYVQLETVSLSDTIESFQYGLSNTEARANYKSASEIKGINGLLISIPASFFQYLFEPMPWHMSSKIDLVSLFENTLRAWLIWKACVGLRKIPSQPRRLVMFAFISYLVAEIVWSFGVINWGTALRHHIPTLGLLLVSAYAFYDKPGKQRMGVI